MTFKDKIEIFHNAMKSRNIPLRIVDPNVFRLVRIFGLKLKPPIFSSFSFNIFTFFCVAIACWLMMVFVLLLFHIVDENGIQDSHLRMISILLIGVIIFGFIGGLVFGIYQSKLKRKYSISSWKELEG